MNFLACGFYYDLRISSVMRFIKGNYVVIHRRPTTVINALKNIIPPILLKEWHSTMVRGAPSIINATVS